MLHPYDPNATAIIYLRYYREQSGRGIKVFKGKSLQRGYGRQDDLQDGEGFFGDLLKKSMPIAATFGKNLLKSGVGLASDIASGKSFKEAAISRGKDVAGETFSSIRSALTGRAVKKKTKKSTTNKRSRGRGGPAKKKRKINRNDVFA